MFKANTVNNMALKKKSSACYSTEHQQPQRVKDNFWPDKIYCKPEP